MQNLNMRFKCMGECCWESVSNAYVFAGAFWMRFGSVLDAFEVRSGVRFKCVLGSVWDVFVRGVCLLVRRILDSGPSPQRIPERIPERNPKRIPKRIQKVHCWIRPEPPAHQRIPKWIPQRIPKRIPKRTFSRESAFLDPFGDPLGPTGPPTDPQKDPKTHFSSKKSAFWDPFGDPFGDPLGAEPHSKRTPKRTPNAL